jgi:hypothetical protein
MQILRLQVRLLVLCLSLVWLSCGKVKTPSRDQIPIIKERFTQLQEGIYNKDKAALDSLMHVNILKKNLSSDSLLNFIYGPDNEAKFETFGRAEIVYTDDYARIESALNDSSGQNVRPMTFTFAYEGEQWLLIDFKAGHSIDSDN